MSPRTAAAIAAVQLGRQPRVGACTCGAEGPEGCSCEWGALIRDLTAVGYHATPIVQATLIPTLMKRMDRVLSAARDAAIRAALVEWTGTKIGFAKLLDISTGRVRAIERRSE